MKSITGTSNMIDVIRACRECGVSRFLQDGKKTEIHFFPLPENAEKKEVPKKEQVEYPEVAPFADDNLIEQDKYESAMDETAELLLTDPLSFEEQIFKGDLIKDEDDSEDQ